MVSIPFTELVDKPHCAKKFAILTPFTSFAFTYMLETEPIVPLLYLTSPFVVVPAVVVVLKLYTRPALSPCRPDVPDVPVVPEVPDVPVVPAVPEVPDVPEVPVVPEVPDVPVVPDVPEVPVVPEVPDVPVVPEVPDVPALPDVPPPTIRAAENQVPSPAAPFKIFQVAMDA